MTIFDALILGIIQGLTEFLPISSSGHLELGRAFLGIDPSKNLLIALILHGATVLSTIVVFRKDLIKLTLGILQFKNNTESKYLLTLVVSAIPIGIAGFLFQKEIESFFFGNILIVGFMLIVTGWLLILASKIPESENSVSVKSAFWIGVAQVIAVLPGISRSGTTIASALILGTKRSEATRFSFLMVLAPIIGANIKVIFEGSISSGDFIPSTLIVGFLAAFITGYIACKWMVSIVQKGKLSYFAYYCFLAGSITIFTVLLQSS